MKSQNYFHTMVIRKYVFALLGVIFLLSTAMRCETTKDFISPIKELNDKRAYITISPEKNVYKIGDTIKCVLSANKREWDNWHNFDKAHFSKFLLYDNNNNNGYYLEPIADISSMPEYSTNHTNGESIIEQIAYYELKKAKIYSLGASDWSSSENKYLSYRTWWDISYTTNNETYYNKVPIYFKNNDKRYIELKVEN